MSYTPIPKNSSLDAALVSSRKAHYYVLSTDAKPTPSTAELDSKELIVLVETDTGSRYIWTGTSWTQTHFKGVQNIHSSCVHNAVINDYIHRHTATATTTTAPLTPGLYVIPVASTVGFAIGDTLHVGSPGYLTEPVHPRVVAVTAGVSLTINQQINNNYPTGSAIVKSELDLSSTAGTLAAPISYKYYPMVGRIEHIKRVILSIIHSAAAEDSLFGDLPALTNGCAFRVIKNGVTKTYTVWRTNSDLILDMFDVIYTDKVGGALFGTRAKGDFSELDVSVILDPATGDYLEILVQDDITALAEFRIKVQGHVEGE